jgi:hypothetical protein
MLVFFADIRRSKANCFACRMQPLRRLMRSLPRRKRSSGPAGWEHSTMMRSASRSARRLTCGPSPSCPLAMPPRCPSALLDAH